MEKLFAGPFGVLLVIAQAAFFIYLMRGLFQSATDDDGLYRTFTTKRTRPAAAAAEPPRAEPSPGGGRGWARTSRTLETYSDPTTGAMTGRVVDGPFTGRRLEDLTRPELMKLYELCRADDPEATEFLALFIQYRFAEPDPRGRFRREERRAPPPREDGVMTRERAYAVLGLAPGADDEEIHRAHRALIKKHHPDHGGSHAKAAEINQAKDMLLG